MALLEDGFVFDCAEKDEADSAIVKEEWPEVDDKLYSDNEPEWKLALRGIVQFLNNDWSQASNLFLEYKDTSTLMCSGYVFINVVQALMSFEDEILEGTIKILHAAQNSTSQKYDSLINREELLCREILLADCYIYESIITFIKQDLKSYIKGGWLLRKAWKIYEKLYKEISSLHKIVHDNQFAYSHTKRISYSSSCDEISPSLEIGNEEIERLFGSVSFGYGLFQLVISMLPPKLLRIIKFLGFNGDEKVGLQAIERAGESNDIKAPIASLALLQYHTVIRPFFALDENIDAGVAEANSILEKCEITFPESSLFLFFKGRSLRLQKQLDDALSTYEKALSLCKEHREIQLLCLYELAWVHLMKLNWLKALSCFKRLKEESRWSKSYYAYMCAVCTGILEDVEGATTLFNQVPQLINHKNNQVEAFVLRRSETFSKGIISKELCTLLGFEILYLWNAIASCEDHTLDKMLEDCNVIIEKESFHLRSLIEGSIYHAKKEDDLAVQCFREAIARHHGMNTDYHVAAFSKFELGKLLTSNQQTYEDGMKHLNEVKDCPKSFDFENRLSVRIHAFMKKVK